MKNTLPACGVIYSSASSGWPQWGGISRVLATMLLIVVPGAVLTLAVFSITLSLVPTSIFVVLISHKIAGPMYRFRTILESLSHRRFETHTRIRPDDQLGELAISRDKAIRTVRPRSQLWLLTMINMIGCEIYVVRTEVMV